MKINGNEIRQGNIIKHQDTIWVAVKCNAVKPGKGGAFNQVELKNLLDGRKLNERFRAAETVHGSDVDSRGAILPAGRMGGAKRRAAAAADGATRRGSQA